MDNIGDFLKDILGINIRDIVSLFLLKSNFLFGVIVLSILFIISIYFLIFQIIEFIKNVNDNKLRKWKIISIISFVSVLLSVFFLNSFKASSIEKPEFINDLGETIESKQLYFVGQKPIFSWSFDQDREINAKLDKQGKELIYKIVQKSQIDNKSILKFEERTSFEAKDISMGEFTYQIIPGYRKKNDRNSNPIFFPLNRYHNSEKLNVSYYPNLFQRIVKKKIFKVLSTGGYNRGFFSFYDREGNKTGFEIELVKELKKSIFNDHGYDVEIDYEADKWVNLLPNLQREEIADIAINTLTKTQEREREYNIRFSEPYLENITLSLIVPDDSDISNEKPQDNNWILDSLEGKEVGVLKNSTAHQAIKKLNQILASKQREKIKIKSRNITGKIIADLKIHKTEFALIDTPYIKSIIKNPRYKVKKYQELTDNLYPEAFPSELSKQSYCIAVNRGHIEFLKKLNTAINTLKDREIIDDLQEKSINKYKSSY